MQKRKTGGFPQILTVIFGIILVGLALWLSGVFDGILETSSTTIDDYTLPQINIILNDVTLDQMKEGDKKTFYDVSSLSVVENGKESIFEQVQIRGRGNATWVYEKRPWQINFSKKVDLLGITKAKKWVLLADYADHTHLRNFLALELASLLDSQYSYPGEMVEVSFDGEYEGLFYLVPKIELDSGSVNLSDEMGVLVELNNFYIDSEYYKTYDNNFLFLKDAVSEKDEEKKEKAMELFLKDFNRLEIAAKKADYDTVSKIADVDDLAKYFIVNEFSLDPDAYFVGTYMYRDGLDDVIHIGPVWDFDMAFGSSWWMNGVIQGAFSSTASMPRRNLVNNNDLFYDLMEIPEFQQKVREVFANKMSGRKEEFLQMVNNQIVRMQGAIKRDAEKWGYTEEYEDETTYVLDWIKKRYEYFEEVYGAK